MKLNLNGFLVLFIVLVAQLTFAQERSVSGTVSDNAGMPLPGVSVLVKGTKNGTQSDFDGKYSIKAASSDILVFSYVGMKASEKSASSTIVNAKLTSDATQLESVVVTAMGFKREKKSLGYAVSEVKAKDLEQKGEGDISRVLSGKASGVTITNGSGISGSATNINIRGNFTVTGNSQPLFIVDGVPFSSSTTNNGRNDFINGNTGSSRFLDLDPNNIENVNILKGLAASTLYGTEGRNGVIVITTKGGSLKKGSKKTEISITQSLFTNEIASLPQYQNKFGNGFDQAFGNFYSNWGPGFYKDGTGGYASPTSGISADGTIPHPYDRANLNAVFPEYKGGVVPYSAKENNVKDFFRTGIVTNTSINIAGASNDGNTSYNLNVGNLSDEGFTPGNKLGRTTISVGGRSVLSNKFTVSGTLNYSKTDFRSPPVALSNGSGVTGTGLSVYSDLFYTPRNVDLMGLPYQNPITGGNVYYRSDGGIVNPNWIVANSYSSQLTNRVFGNAALKYDINPHLNLLYRFGVDIFTERNESGTNKGAGKGPVLGEYRTSDVLSSIWDHNVILNGQYNLNDDLGLNFNIGATTRSSSSRTNGVRSVDQIVFNVFRDINFKTQTPFEADNITPIQDITERNVAGLYAQAEFDYKKWAYLTVSERKDWVSNTNINTKDYPSASIAFVPTKAFESISTTNGLNFLKLRIGYGTSANFATGYPTSTVTDLVAKSSQDDNSNTYPSITVSTLLANPDIKPEILKEIEVGFDSRLLNNRVSLDFSYFKRRTNDLITRRPIASSVGYANMLTNVGQIDGYGIEVDLGLAILRDKNSGLNWDINSNFSKGRSTVTDLGADTKQIVYSGYSNLGNAAIQGETLGVIVGSRIKRDASDNYVVNSTGQYVIEEGTFIIGDPTPDFVLNVSNSLSYKNINFGFLINYTQGGDIYSQTINTLIGRGVTTDTEDRLNTFILPGVKEDGTVNNIQINNSDYYFSNLMSGANEGKIYDATVIRLSEVSLGYSFPSKILEKTAFGALSFTISGINLYHNAINTPKGTNFDPNVAGTGVGNGRGFDHLNGPTGKRIGFSIKASF
jgi:TonB-linked SusC/RagA family outer membrane protein